MEIAMDFSDGEGKPYLLSVIKIRLFHLISIRDVLGKLDYVPG